MDHALQNWNLTVSQLSIYFEGRLDDVLDIRANLVTRNYLRDSNPGLAEISFLLGYSCLSSFSDGFTRWIGKTPGQYGLA